MKKVRLASSRVMVTDRCYQTAAGMRRQTALIFYLRAVIRQDYFISAVLLARMRSLKKKLRLCNISMRPWPHDRHSPPLSHRLNNAYCGYSGCFFPDYGGPL